MKIVRCEHNVLFLNCLKININLKEKGKTFSLLDTHIPNFGDFAIFGQ